MIIKVDIAIGSPGPDELGDGIDEGLHLCFSLLARGDVADDIDEVADMVVSVLVRRDRDLKVQVHPFPGGNHRLEPHDFARASAGDGGA